MPELPEVETIRRQLEPLVVKRTVTAAWAFPHEKFMPATFVLGATIEGVARRGKYLLVELNDDRELVVHLGMTGRLLPGSPGDGPRAQDVDESGTHVRARWWFDDHTTLAFHDVRRFGRIRVAEGGRYEGALATLGPEPFSDEFTPGSLYQAVGRSRRHLKTQLLGQRPVAGLGNIYADEACFLAGIHPASRRVTKNQAAALHEAIRDVLHQGIVNGGTTLRDYVNAAGDTGDNQHHLRCYGRWDEPCVRCGDTLRRTTLDARTTTWCPTCQPR